MEGRKSKKDVNAGVETERQDVVRKREAEKSTMQNVKKSKWQAKLDTWDKDRAPSYGPAVAAKMRTEETIRRKKEEAMWAKKAEEKEFLAKEEKNRLKRMKKKEIE
jgi:hypothetical protein